jgi:hypothetical protein
VDTKNWPPLLWREFHPSDSTLDSIFGLLRTCFWAGDTFAPKLRIKESDDGPEIPIQKYLQDAFLNMYQVLVRAIGDVESVLGFEVFHCHFNT